MFVSVCVYSHTGGFVFVYLHSRFVFVYSRTGASFSVAARTSYALYLEHCSLIWWGLATGYKFRPGGENTYLAVVEEDDLEDLDVTYGPSPCLIPPVLADGLPACAEPPIPVAGIMTLWRKL